MEQKATSRSSGGAVKTNLKPRPISTNTKSTTLSANVTGRRPASTIAQDKTKLISESRAQNVTKVESVRQRVGAIEKEKEGADSKPKKVTGRVIASRYMQSTTSSTTRTIPPQVKSSAASATQTHTATNNLVKERIGQRVSNRDSRKQVSTTSSSTFAKPSTLPEKSEGRQIHAVKNIPAKPKETSTMEADRQMHKTSTQPPNTDTNSCMPPDSASDAPTSRLSISSKTSPTAQLRGKPPLRIPQLKTSQPAKDSLNNEEEISHLQTRLTQWCFLNARSAWSFEQQKIQAEEQLLAVWKMVRDMNEEIMREERKLKLEKEIYAVDHILRIQQENLDAILDELNTFTEKYVAYAEALARTTSVMPISQISIQNLDALQEQLDQLAQLLESNLLEGGAGTELIQDFAKALKNTYRTIQEETRELRECEKLLVELARMEAWEQSTSAQNIQFRRMLAIEK
ncbi:uncharacterized protein VTP21DRAFT_4168 [Calcarisporiella thermophila]|uniref:uncharacterized protein n=1 Tax=Calcarisporiella thermophila TaxID=911321 RepID=UPI003743FE2A